MKTTRRALMFGMAATVCAPSIARAEVQVDGGPAFGSSWRITVGRDGSVSRLRPLVEAVIAEIDQQMSPYREDSDLCRFNAAQTLDWQVMPRGLCHVATQALGLARETDGAFDPTVGPLVSRLGFGPIRGRAGHYTGLKATATALRKEAPGLTLDPCGIAKGYALDRIVGELEQAGVFDAMVEIGGEVRALGRHPDGRPWNVGVANPGTEGFSVHRVVAPGTNALATSGHAPNGVTGPVSTSHIIDPLRQRSASPDLLSVTVLAPTGIEADALATALCAGGPVAGVRLARRLEIPALFLRRAEDGPVEVMTGSFSRHVLI